MPRFPRRARCQAPTRRRRWLVLEERLESGELELDEALGQLDARRVELDEELLASVNTERDLDRLRALAT